MSVIRRLKQACTKLVLQNVWWRPHDIVDQLAKMSGLTTEAAKAHVDSMVERGLIRRMDGPEFGVIYGPSYRIEQSHEGIAISGGADEWAVYDKLVKPDLVTVPENIREICSYGVTEMVNNVFDHSGGSEMKIAVRLAPSFLQIQIVDNGIGIFKKIMGEFGLESERYAIERLVKGKVTTSPKEHSGEGLFFTSRMFERFTVMSSGHIYTIKGGTDFSTQVEMGTDVFGTAIVLETRLENETTMHSVFEQFQANDEDLKPFDRTVVPLILSVQDGDILISRSQAKRVMSGVEKFRRATIDFKGISQVGPSFIDEIFRVFRLRNPSISLEASNVNAQIEPYIRKALAAESAEN